MVVISLRNFSDQNFAPLQEIFEELLVTLFKSIFSLKQKNVLVLEFAFEICLISIARTGNN